MKLAYVRVSSVQQHEDRQIEYLKKHNIEKWFIEKISGKNMKRPKLQEMIEFAREGDIIYIHDFSRLARSTKDLLYLVEKLESKGVILISIKESFDTSTPTGKLMLTMIAAINEFERQNLLERQKEGIALAVQEGRFKGGSRKKIDKKIFNECYVHYCEGKINKKQFAERICVSRPTLNKLLEEYTKKDVVPFKEK